MDISDLTDGELAILARFLRGQAGHAIRGWATINIEEIVRGLPGHLRGAGKAAVDGLYKKGFLSRKPKPNGMVYSLKSSLDPELQAIIEKLTEDPSIADRFLGRVEAKAVPEPSKVFPALLEDLLSTLQKDRWIQILEVANSDTVDFVDEVAHVTYQQAYIRLRVTCPRTKETFERETVVGNSNRFVTQTELCPSCGSSHKFRAGSLVY